MKKEIVVVKMFISDRNFLESIKRKLKLKSLTEAQSKLVTLFKKNKLHLDLNLIESKGGQNGNRKQNRI